MYENILVPLDGSKNAQKALSVAIKLAKTFSSKLTLLSVIDNRNFSGNRSVVNTAPIVTTDEITELSKYSDNVINAGLQVVKDNGLEAKTLIKRGYPKSIIATDVPTDENIDLIVMGKSGTGALDRLIMGSTTAYVVRNAHVQVLVVNDD
ncbi:MAG: universal stress protein [Lactobacillus sp.]|jgi:nucleotide-binding universal stress UspA family protein|nr:MAG: universal stress protein [Lactobacillus sp.]